MFGKKKQDNKEKSLKPLTHGDVAKIKISFKDVIEKKLRKATTANMSESHIHALRKYIIVQTLNRSKSPTKDLKQTAQLKETEIRQKTTLEASPLFNAEQRKENKESAQNRYKKHGHGLLGTGIRRLYFPLLTPENKTSRTEKSVEKYLNKKGYFIRNYKQGYATDIVGKQEYKIGKLIKEDEKLSKSFMMDDTRFSDNQYFVLSDYANDIAHMSTRRGWQSCMSHNGIYKDEPKHDVEHGTLVGYLINKNDPYIFNPLARILFKPLYNAKGDVKYKTNKSYGLTHDIFKDTAKLIATQISSKEAGLFQMPKKVYNDGTIGREGSIPEGITAEEFFNIIDIKYTKSPSGNITIQGDLDISNLNLTELPDLTNVTVLGDFDCSSNKLTSLIGAPQNIQKGFFCYNNQLTTLKGMPKILLGEMDCSRNELTSLKGMPKILKGTFKCGFNELTSLKYCPTEIYGRFLCANNKLESLKYAPQIVTEDFICNHNKLKSLIGAPQKIGGGFECSENNITSLRGLPLEINGHLYCYNNPLISLIGAPKSDSRIITDLGVFRTYRDIPKKLLTEHLTRKIFCKVQQAFS